MTRQPKWITPERQARLVDLFLRSQGFCVFGHKPCPYPEHHYQLFIENLIKDWIADDRAQRQAEWRAEQKAMHSLGERPYTRRGEWSAIGKDVFYDRQPLFYIVGYGVSGLTHKPFAKVSIASSSATLLVDLSQAVRGMSKNQRRKALRHHKGGGVPLIHKACRKAVGDYLK